MGSSGKSERIRILCDKLHTKEAAVGRKRMKGMRERRQVVTQKTSTGGDTAVVYCVAGRMRETKAYKKAEAVVEQHTWIRSTRSPGSPVQRRCKFAPVLF